MLSVLPAPRLAGRLTPNYGTDSILRPGEQTGRDQGVLTDSCNAKNRDHSLLFFYLLCGVVLRFLPTIMRLQGYWKFREQRRRT